MKISVPPAALTLLVLFGVTEVALAAPVAPARDAGGRAWLTVFPALFLLCGLPLAVYFRAKLTLPDRVASTIRERPYTALLVGAGNLLLLVILGWGAERAPAVGPFAALVFLAVLLAAFFGLLGCAAGIGRRLYADGPRGESVAAFTLGWLVVSGLSLLPVAGFLVLLWLAAQGIGGVLLSLGKREPGGAEVPSEEPGAPPEDPPAE